MIIILHFLTVASFQYIKGTDFLVYIFLIKIYNYQLLKKYSMKILKNYYVLLCYYYVIDASR